MPVPANYRLGLVVQDTNGYKALTELSGYDSDISVDVGAVGIYYGQLAAWATALQALSNGKIVRQSITFEFNLAQRPTNSPALYPNVNTRALMRFGNGYGARMLTSVPAPKEVMFVATPPDQGLIVDPSVGAVGTLITAIETAANGPGGPFNEFDGGQLVGGKPRRRRVVLGA